MSDITQIIIAVFASSGFWGIAQTLIINRKQKKDLERNGILALLHDRIYDIAESAIVKGSISFDEFDNLTALYEPYKAMGGNGTGKALYEKAKDLPRGE